MTQIRILAEKHETADNAAKTTGLSTALQKQIRREKASFHTPGHKGRLILNKGENPFTLDLTELDGLDQLSCPSDVLDSVQKRLSEIHQSQAAFISVNGASAALCAALIASAQLGKKLLLPRNAHRSALSALVLAGLEPIWYECGWLSKWQCWSAPDPGELLRLIEEESPAAVLVVSPNYEGVIANLAPLVSACKQRGVLLIVDAAHGAHFCGKSLGKINPLAQGADIVVHSLHKTLSAATQTGALHLGKESPLSSASLQAALNLMQSSSPSYLLMCSIEESIDLIENSNKLEECLNLAARMRSILEQTKGISILNAETTGFNIDPLHILIKHDKLTAADLYKMLADKGIYAEAQLGNGVLLLLGLMSNENDIELLQNALLQINLETSDFQDAETVPEPAKPQFPEQQVLPRRAFFASQKAIPLEKADGMIAAEWLAPCPPGYALIGPGQRISPEIFKFIDRKTTIKVMDSGQFEGETDGPNTSS